MFPKVVPEERAAEDEGDGDAEPHEEEREERSEGHGARRLLLTRKPRRVGPHRRFLLSNFLACRGDFYFVSREMAQISGLGLVRP